MSSSSSSSSSSVSLPLSLLPLLIPSPYLFPQITLHSILSFSNKSYGQNISVSNLFNGKNGQETNTVVVDVDTGSFNPQLGKANAVFVMLCRNEEVDGAIKSIRELEDRFNHKYHYPWVFLNEVEFTDDFKKCSPCHIPLNLANVPRTSPRFRRVTMVTYSKVEFGVIPHDHWYQPDWIDEDKASRARKQMEEENVIYGGTRR